MKRSVLSGWLFMKFLYKSYVNISPSILTETKQFILIKFVVTLREKIKKVDLSDQSCLGTKWG